jgi:hypothetical protein
MPFHVEIRRSYNHARVFNVGEEELRRTVLEPWSRGGVVELGDREWDPRDCGLVVLEGPALAASDLALGQGWHRAERSARDVTARVLAELRSEPATVAVLAATPAGRRLAAALLERLGLRPVDWPRYGPGPWAARTTRAPPR